MRLLFLPAASGSLLFNALLSHQRVAECDSAHSHLASRIGAYTYPANNPIEDRYVHGSFGDWRYSAVFDGHGGFQVSDIASKRLLHIIANKLEAGKVKETDKSAIDALLSKSFNEMEHEIIEVIRPSFKMGFGNVAKVGSCVLLALHRKNHLIIANCGDCRAVLGTSPDHATIINRDHNCRVPLEQTLLQSKHPNESDLVVCKSARACYVKGRLQLTRSLGDAYLKYAEFNGTPDRTRGRFIPEPYTPPYVSHEPEVHHITLAPEDKFVILATDGLWDELSHTDAVRIVFRCKAAGLTEEDAAKALVERALQNAAADSKMSYQELLQLPQGSRRRGRHDDTTAIVMYL